MSERIRIVALGGLDEEGKNCTVVQIGDDIFVVDCGVRFPDRTMPGIDYVVPDFTWLIENKAKIKAYLLTHGHDDQIGALAYLYGAAPSPIYASKSTILMFKLFNRHVGKEDVKYDFHEIAPSSSQQIAGRKVTFFQTAHNVARSSGVAISTAQGSIVFSGDYVIENNADPAFYCDLNAVARLAEQPTLVLLSESGYADRSGYTAPHYKLRPVIEQTAKNAPGRIFVSIFSINFYNVHEIVQLAIELKKRVIPYDAQTDELLRTMVESGEIQLPKENYAPTDDLIRYRDTDILVLMLAFGEKLYKKMAGLARDMQEDKRYSLKESDTFIAAAPSNPNTEVEATDALDALYRSGCHVLNCTSKMFCNMHASEEDLKMMISLLKPKYYVPVKGLFKNLLCNAKLALSMGVGLTHSNVFVLDNGASLLIEEDGSAHVMDEKIPHGDVMIDGIGVGDVGGDVLQDRQKLAEGVVVLAVTISKGEKRIVGGPDVQMRGFVFLKDSEMILREVSKIFVQTVNEFLDPKVPYNLDEIKQNVYEKCLRSIRRQTGKEPMVLPLLVEVA